MRHLCTKIKHIKNQWPEKIYKNHSWTKRSKLGSNDAAIMKTVNNTG